MYEPYGPGSPYYSLVHRHAFGAHEGRRACCPPLSSASLICREAFDEHAQRGADPKKREAWNSEDLCWSPHVLHGALPPPSAGFLQPFFSARLQALEAPLGQLEALSNHI